MAKEKEEEQRTAVDNINDSLTGIEQKVQNNQKMIVYGTIIVAVIAAIVLIWIYWFRTPGINSANDAIGQADTQLMLGNDSVALAQYKQVADEYGYDAGNRAKLNAAILLYREKKYQEAINYLNGYAPTEEVIGASAKCLEGDCYVNLKNYDKALECFKEAQKISADNPDYTPYFMMKQATVYHELKNYKEEAAIYREILDKYPLYGDQNRIDIEKYALRAEELAK